MTLNAYMEYHPEVGDKVLSKYSDDPESVEEVEQYFIDAELSKVAHQASVMSTRLQKVASVFFHDLLKEYGNRGNIAIYCCYVAFAIGSLVVIYLVCQHFMKEPKAKIDFEKEDENSAHHSGGKSTAQNPGEEPPVEVLDEEKQGGLPDLELMIKEFDKQAEIEALEGKKPEPSSSYATATFSKENDHHRPEDKKVAVGFHHRQSSAE